LIFFFMFYKLIFLQIYKIIFIFPNLTHTNTSYSWCVDEGKLGK
jgi:hypothetical protein